MWSSCLEPVGKPGKPVWRNLLNRLDPARIVAGRLALTVVGLALAVPAPVSHPAVASGDARREAAIGLLEKGAAVSSSRVDAGDSTKLAARDSALDRARAARALIRHDASAHSRVGGQGMPDPLTARAIVILIDAYSRALLHESAVLSAEARSARLGARADRFPEIWGEAVGELLDLLSIWPATRSRALVTPEGEIDLPGLLLSLCLRDAHCGETFELPRECLPLRMCTLPDSLAAYCMDDERCRQSGSGPDCATFVVGLMAESLDQDALVSFRYGAAYWSLPDGSSPRSPAKDGRVAGETVRYLAELLEASEAAEPQGPGTVGGASRHPGRSPGAALLHGGEVPITTALDLLRASGRLWPPSIDPFATVPGLRNPRWGELGGLLCDVALYGSTLKSLNGGTRTWLTERLGADRKIVLVEPR